MEKNTKTGLTEERATLIKEEITNALQQLSVKRIFQNWEFTHANVKTGKTASHDIGFCGGYMKLIY